MKPTITCLAYRPAVATDRPTTMQLLLTVEAPQIENIKRPRLNLGLSLDRSGSMSGQPMERAKEAAIGLIGNLHADDLVSAVLFDHELDVAITSQPARDTAELAGRLRGVEARGSTNLFAGFLEAGHQVKSGLDPQRFSRVVILSDGQANQGLTDLNDISQQVKRWNELGVSTTTVGLGAGYNEDLLAGMATAGGGNFYHVQNSEDLETLFQVELNGLSNTFGRSVSLRIETLNGVELLRVVNSLERDEHGHLKLADMVHGCPIDVVTEFLVPAQEPDAELIRLCLQWTDLETGEERESEEILRLPVVPHGQLAEFPTHPKVMEKRALQLAAQSLKEVSFQISARNYDKAEELLEASLRLLDEAESTPDIEFYRGRFEELLQKVKRGELQLAGKEAKSYGTSLSIGSFSMAGWIRDFVALPPEERTPERFQQMMKEAKGE